MATQRGEEFDLRLASWMGGAAVLIWAVHPYATMATGYITNRQETLMVLFYLLSIWALLRDREGWSLILAVTSFLSKEVAVTLPGALWLVDWAGGGKGIIETFRRRARFYGVLTTVWLFLCYWHAKGGRTGHVTITGMPLATPIEYFKAEMYVIVEYFWKLVVPVKLQFYPYIRAVSSWQQWVPWLVLIVAYIGLAVYSLRWSRWLAVVLVFPLLVLSPTSTVIPIPFEPKMEYRFYLPAAALIGLFTIAVWKHVRPVWAKAVVLGTVFVVMATLSHLRSRDYTDNIRLFEQQVSVDPGSLTGLEALSMAYMNKGMMERAEATAWKIVDWSLEQKANDFAGRGFNLLGIIADDRRDYAKAKDFFQRSIGIAGSIQAKVNLAQVHVRLYELEEGEKLLQEILAVQPDAPMALLLMFEAQMSGKKYDQAEKLLDKIIAFFPEKAAELDIQRTRLMNLRRKEESAKP
jgi:tetratricopeptide (TPR) repeat protein